MNAKHVAVTGLALLALLGTGCINKLKARDELNKGTAAFKSAKYPEAIEHFKTSLRLSPRDRMGIFGLSLGAAYFFRTGHPISARLGSTTSTVGSIKSFSTDRT